MEKEKISAQLIADSMSPQGHRITSFVLTYPRFIHGELMTHRMFSRNSASSRAIPFKTMVKMVKEDPFIPIAWQKDHRGMQGTEYFTTLQEIKNNTHAWVAASYEAIKHAAWLNNLQVTKQLCNRLLEPFMWHTVLVTATEWDNFFELRCPKYEIYAGPEDTEEYACRGKSWKDLMKSNNGLAGDFDTEDIVEKLQYSKSGAEIHIQALAEAMWDARNESKPQQLKAGEYHIPFKENINEKEINNILGNGGVRGNYWGYKEVEIIKLKIATARCARLSYMTFDGEINYQKDIDLHNILLESKHASSFEHCCRVLTQEEYEKSAKTIIDSNGKLSIEKGWVDNFKGFISYRRLLNI
ncbi:MAG: hypothetical protein ACOH2V_01030 [Candidatus Saccharimonadaceae bacterium]